MAGLFEQLGMNFDPQAELRAQREAQAQRAMSAVPRYNNPGVQSAGQLGALVGAGAAGVTLTDQQRQMQSIKNQSQQQIDLWTKDNPDASEQDKALQFSDIVAAAAIRNGRSDIGAQLLQQTASQRQAKKQSDSQLELLGYQNRAAKAKALEAERGGFSPIWKVNETNADKSFDARIDPSSGDAVLGDGTKIPLGQYTTHAPLSPAQQGQTGASAAAEAAPYDVTNAALDIMYDPSRIRNYASYGKTGQLRRDELTARRDQLLKDAGMTMSEVLRQQAVAKAQIKSVSDLTGMQNAVSAYETLARGNGQRFLELASKVNKSGTPLFNSAARLAKLAVGDPDAAEMMQVLQTYQTEVARIVSQPKLTGQLTDAARNEVKNITPANVTVGQATRLINRLNVEFDLRQRGIGEALQTAAQAGTGWLPGGGGQGTSAPSAADIDNARKYPNAPKIGTYSKGHEYLGGDPAQETSWRSAK